MDKAKNIINTYIVLQIALLIYSVGGVSSKLAGQQKFLSYKFIFYYIAVLCVMCIYAVMWQQILKKLSLFTAYAHKAVTVIWGIIWGKMLFDEQITFSKVLGAIVIVFGIFLITNSNEKGAIQDGYK